MATAATNVAVSSTPNPTGDSPAVAASSPAASSASPSSTNVPTTTAVSASPSTVTAASASTDSASSASTTSASTVAPPAGASATGATAATSSTPPAATPAGTGPPSGAEGTVPSTNVTEVSNKLPTPLLLGDFDMGVTLGTGSFGRVRFATYKPNQTYWAIKMLKKAEIIRLQQIEHMLSEKNILFSLSHPFIVNLAGTFQDLKYIYMVLEYVIGGEFFTHLRRAGRFENNATKFYAAQVLLIFESLHSKDIIYRDLKPENLLLDNEGYLKITDFGFAKHVAFKTYTLCGTPEYIAPEVLLNKGHGKGVDWWTLGILMYEMLAGQPPFCDEDPMGIYQQILSNQVNFPKFFDRHSKNLIKKLLTSDLTKRYGCLKNGVADIKTHKYFNGMEWDKLLAKQLPPMIVPKTTTANDTSNFDPYPDSIDEALVPIYSGKDPFLDF